MWKDGGFEWHGCECAKEVGGGCEAEERGEGRCVEGALGIGEREVGVECLVEEGGEVVREGCPTR